MLYLYFIKQTQITQVMKTKLTSSDIQAVKGMLVRYINANSWTNHNLNEFKDDCLWLVGRVKDDSENTFAISVAATVEKYRSCSEKQAYVIAKAACEMGLEFDII